MAPRQYRQYQIWSAPVLVPLAIFGWFAPLSEPVQIEPGLSAAWGQVTSVGSANVEVNQVTGSFVEPLSEPVRIKPSLQVASQQSFTMDWQWSAPTAVTEYNWFAWLSEPNPRPKAGLLASAQPFFAIDTNWGPPAPRMDSWYRLLAEPVRSKQAVPWQQPFTTDWRFVRPSAQDFPNWYAWLSEPVRQKIGLNAAQQQFFTIDTNWNAPAPRADSWFNWLAEPVRSKQAVAYQQPFTMDWQWTAPGAVTDLRNFWFNWLSEPVRSKQSVPWQQSFAMDWKWERPTAQDFPDWYSWLSEPVRSKQAVAYQQPFTMDWKWDAPPAFTDLRNFWFRPLSEPVRSKVGLRASLQQSFTMDWRWSAPAPRLDSWFNRLSEPVQSKKAVVWQQPFTMDWAWQAPPAVIFLNWYGWLAEPVRVAPSLWAANQQFFTMDWKWEPPPAITYTFSITEIGDSGAFTFVASSQVLGADVTITEIRATTTEVAITEINPFLGTYVTITEIPADTTSVGISEELY